jgi:hypothetical protein
VDTNGTHQEQAMSSHNHPSTEQDWPTYAAPPNPSAAEPNPPAAAEATLPNAHAGHQSGHDGHQGGHGGHKWMMLLMCLPLVLIGIWSFASGGGFTPLIGGLLCMGMMAVMHLGMGAGHRH